jgi:hypothetical protein
MKFGSREHVKLWILENQNGRRNLTDDQRAAIAFRIAKQRSLVEKVEHGARVKEALKAKAARELQKADPALFEKVVNRELSLAEAKKLLKESNSLKSKKEKELADLESANAPFADSENDKSNGSKKISEKKAKQVKEAAKKPRPKKRKAEVRAKISRARRRSPTDEHARLVNPAPSRALYP